MNGPDFKLQPSPRLGDAADSFPARPGGGLRVHGGPLYAALICIAATFALLMFRLDARAGIDDPLILALNQFSGRWPALDRASVVVQEFNLPKGGLIFALAAAAFAVCPTVTGRARLVAGCLGAALAALASRIAQLFLPSIPRPLFDPGLPFKPPVGEPDGEGHAEQQGGVVAGKGAPVARGAEVGVDRRIGLAAFAVFLVAAVARVYGGLHYPTDMLGGAALSAACVFAVRSVDLSFVENHRGWFYRYRAAWAALAFLFAFQAASLFDDLRAIAILLKRWT